MDFPFNKTNTVTDATFLYRGLGSFWTQVFEDKETLKGYSLGQAEEITQRYLDLLEVINSYSIDKIDVFHRTKWKPINILKSKINATPFVFNPGDTVFGEQPISATNYYGGEIFKFGKPKTPTAKVYEYYVGDSLTEFHIIADRVIDPSKVYLYGTDVILKDSVLVFNADVFNDPNLSTFDVFNDNGELVTYVDNEGNTQTEQSMVLWAYNGSSDISALYNAFGCIFNIHKTSSQFYKDLLSGLIKLFVNGPTVGILKKLFATFAQLPYVLNTEETVEQLYTANGTTTIITDKEVYKLSTNYELARLRVGQILHKGDYLSTNIEFFDNLSGVGGWWKRTGLIRDQLAFSRCLFFGPYLDQLGFSVEASLVTLDENGDIKFPAIGHPEDIIRFNKYLNSNATRKTKIKQAFSLTNPGDSYMIFPLDFVMDNFLKQNTAFFKIVAPTHDQLASIMDLIPLLKSCLPPYVYLILKMDTNIDPEEYSNLNGDIVEIAFTDESKSPTNADGSNSSGVLESLDPYFFNEPTQRLFGISKGLPPPPYETVYSINATNPGAAQIIDGALRRTPTAGDSTIQFNKLLFLDFS